MAYINLDINEVIKNFNDPNGDLLRSFIITSIDDTINLKVNGVSAIINREYSPASLVSVEYKGEITDITLLNNSTDEEQCTVEFAVLNVSEHANLINSGYNVLEYDTVNNKVKYQRVTNGVIENAETDYTETTNPYLGSFTLKVSDNNTSQICWSEDATITVNFTPECEVTPSCSANVDSVNITSPGRFKKSNFTKDLYADKVMITSLNLAQGPGSYVTYNGLNIFEHFYDLNTGHADPDAKPIIIPFSDFNNFLYYLTELDNESTNSSVKGFSMDYKLGYLNTTNYTIDECNIQQVEQRANFCIGGCEPIGGLKEPKQVTVCVDGYCMTECAAAGTPCPSGTYCINGVCVDRCEAQGNTCTGAEVCVGEICVDECTANGTPCVGDELCDDGTCVDCITDANCPDGVCGGDGNCYADECEAGGFPCPDGSICENGQCVQQELEKLLWLDLTNYRSWTTDYETEVVNLEDISGGEFSGDIREYKKITKLRNKVLPLGSPNEYVTLGNNNDDDEAVFLYNENKRQMEVYETSQFGSKTPYVTYDFGRNIYNDFGDITIIANLRNTALSSNNNGEQIYSLTNYNELDDAQAGAIREPNSPGLYCTQGNRSDAINIISSYTYNLNDGSFDGAPFSTAINNYDIPNNTSIITTVSINKDGNKLQEFLSREQDQNLLNVYTDVDFLDDNAETPAEKTHFNLFASNYVNQIFVDTWEFPRANITSDYQLIELRIYRGQLPVEKLQEIYVEMQNNMTKVYPPFDPLNPGSNNDNDNGELPSLGGPIT